MTTPADLSHLTNDQLMDMWTPTIFFPSAHATPQLRRSVEAQNRAVEAELNRRGIYRTS